MSHSTVSEEQLRKRREAFEDELENNLHQGPQWQAYPREMIAICDLALERLRSASAAPVEGVAVTDEMREATCDAIRFYESTVLLTSNAAEHKAALKARNNLKNVYVLLCNLQDAAKAPAAPPPVEAPTGEKWLRLGKLSIAMRPDGETYVLESEAVAALRTDTAPTCGVTEDAARLLWFANDIGVDQIGDIDLHERSTEYASVHGGEPKPEDFLRAVRDAIDAARLSKGERGRGEAPLSRGDPA